MTDEKPISREALQQFAQIMADGYRRQDSLTVAEAAREAYCAGGPSIPEIETLITRQRVHRTYCLNPPDRFVCREFCADCEAKVTPEQIARIAGFAAGKKSQGATTQR